MKYKKLIVILERFEGRFCRLSLRSAALDRRTPVVETILFDFNNKVTLTNDIEL